MRRHIMKKSCIDCGESSHIGIGAMGEITRGSCHILSLPPPVGITSRGILWHSNGDQNMWQKWHNIAFRRDSTICGKNGKTLHSDGIRHCTQTRFDNSLPLKSRVVVIPPHIPDTFRPGPEAEVNHRDILAIFIGKTRCGINEHCGEKNDRKIIVDVYGVSEQIAAVDIKYRSGPFRDASEADLFRRAVFGLCPRGSFLWTPRPVLSVYSGAIPVIIDSDNESVIPPFARSYDWDSFSIRIWSQQVSQLKEILTTVTGTERKRLLDNAAPLKAVLQSRTKTARAVLQETAWIMNKCD